MSEISYTAKGLKKEQFLNLEGRWKVDGSTIGNVDYMEYGHYVRLEDTPEGLKFIHEKRSPYEISILERKVHTLVFITEILMEIEFDYETLEPIVIPDYQEISENQWVIKGIDSVAGILASKIVAPYTFEYNFDSYTQKVMENNEPVVVILRKDVSFFKHMATIVIPKYAIGSLYGEMKKAEHRIKAIESFIK